MSPYTGQTLPYNIHLPTVYNPNEQYPLVLFIHDAGVASGPVTQTLYQGNGATSWVEPEAQTRHKCIVVALEIVMMLKEPELSAGALLVAGK